MATRKYPPDGRKSAAEKFGNYMNARDVRGNPMGQGAAIKKRADELKKAFTRLQENKSGTKPKVTDGSEGPKKGSVAAARRAAGSEGPKKPRAAKRPVRGGGSLQGDLAKFGAAVRKNNLDQRAANLKSAKAKQTRNRKSNDY